MHQAGRWIGFLASVTTLILWAVFLFANPYGSEGISNDTCAAAAVMVALAAVAVRYLGQLGRPAPGIGSLTLNLTSS